MTTEKLYLVKGDTARFLREFGGLALTELTSEEIEHIEEIIESEDNDKCKLCIQILKKLKQVLEK